MRPPYDWELVIDTIISYQKEGAQTINGHLLSSLLSEGMGNGFEDRAKELISGFRIKLGDRWHRVSIDDNGYPKIEEVK